MAGVELSAATGRTDARAVAAPCLKLDFAVDEREQRVVSSEADVVTGMIDSANLADQDVTSGNDLTVVALDATHLRVRVATVAAGALTFFMSHRSFL